LFPIPLSDPRLFTGTPRWQEFIANDPLALREATARFLVESVRLDGYLRFVPRWVNVPALLMLAGQDQIINNQRTRGYLQRFATPDKTVLEYADAQHTLEFEPNPDPFIDDLIAWLRHREKQFVQGRQLLLQKDALPAKVLNPGVC
jgi:alpha-beta hydrolase superfamily lysophospholipase